MATNNGVNVSLSGRTGTGSFVGSTSPTLVTPILGVASATSINFGAGALSSYVPKTNFTASFSFVTTGDLSVSYSQQTSYYQQIGENVFIVIRLDFTPTFSTSSGFIVISGLPIACVTASGYNYPLIVTTTAPSGTPFVYPSGCTALAAFVLNGTTTMSITGFGSSAVSTRLGVSNVTSASPYSMTISGYYAVS